MAVMEDISDRLVTAREIGEARAGAPPQVRLTPVLPAARRPQEAGAERLLVKCENLQVTGSYKARAAFHIVGGLEGERRERGIVMASSGNFAQAFAYAGAAAGVPTAVVMPEYTAPVKVEAAARYGAEVVMCDSFDARMPTVRRVAAERGMLALDTFESPPAIAGHGTIGLEMLEQAPQAGTVLVPISSGGLAAGIAAAVKSARPDIRVIGVQPEGANAAYVSWRAGEPTSIPRVETMADALTGPRPGTIPFRHLQAFLDDIVLVSEEEIAAAVRTLLFRVKILAEPGGAVAAAAFLSGKVSPPGVVLALVSGGNADPSVVAKILAEGDGS